jgi:hypothetical protein
MTDTELAGRPLPSPPRNSTGEAPSAPVDTPPTVPIKAASTKEVFGRGLLLILGEMAQLVLTFVLAIFVLACCAALAVKANDATHFMGEKFGTPRVVINTLGGLLEHSTTYLIVGLLAAIFAMKFLDLVVRVIQRRARLAERGYPVA